MNLSCTLGKIIKFFIPDVNAEFRRGTTRTQSFTVYIRNRQVVHEVDGVTSNENRYQRIMD